MTIQPIPILEKDSQAEGERPSTPTQDHDLYLPEYTIHDTGSQAGDAALLQEDPEYSPHLQENENEQAPPLPAKDPLRFEKRESSHEDLNEPEQEAEAEAETSSNPPKCALFPSSPATWNNPRTAQHLSDAAVRVLYAQGLLDPADLEPLNSTPSSTQTQPTPMNEAAAPQPETSQKPRTTNPLSTLTLLALKLPRDVTMSLTKGFENIPLAYNDTTTRRPAPVVTGLGTGVVAAGKVLTLGIYDGLTGFILHPITGAKENGIAGFGSGFAKGVGGLVCKPCAGACGVPAYMLEGVHVEIGKSVEKMSCGGKKWIVKRKMRMEMRRGKRVVVVVGTPVKME